MLKQVLLCYTLLTFGYLTNAAPLRQGQWGVCEEQKCQCQLIGSEIRISDCLLPANGIVLKKVVIPARVNTLHFRNFIVSHPITTINLNPEEIFTITLSHSNAITVFDDRLLLAFKNIYSLSIFKLLRLEKIITDFRKFENLQVIVITFNPRLKRISETVFALPKITYMRLSNNAIDFLQPKDRGYYYCKQMSTEFSEFPLILNEKKLECDNIVWLFCNVYCMDRISQDTTCLYHGEHAKRPVPITFHSMRSLYCPEIASSHFKLKMQRMFSESKTATIPAPVLRTTTEDYNEEDEVTFNELKRSRRAAPYYNEATYETDGNTTLKAAILIIFAVIALAILIICISNSRDPQRQAPRNADRGLYQNLRNPSRFPVSPESDVQRRN